MFLTGEQKGQLVNVHVHENPDGFSTMEAFVCRSNVSLEFRSTTIVCMAKLEGQYVTIERTILSSGNTCDMGADSLNVCEIEITGKGVLSGFFLKF